MVASEGARYPADANVVLWHPGGSDHADEGQNTEMK